MGMCEREIYAFLVYKKIFLLFKKNPKNVFACLLNKYLHVKIKIFIELEELCTLY